MLHVLTCLALIALCTTLPQPLSAQRLASDVQSLTLRIFGDDGSPITWRSGDIRIVADTVPADMRYHFEDFARDIFLPDTTISGFEFPVDAFMRRGDQEMGMRVHSGVHLDSIPFRSGLYHFPPSLGNLFNLRLYGGRRIIGRDVASFRVPSLDLLPEWSTFEAGTVLSYAIDNRRCDGEDLIQKATFLQESWDGKRIFFHGIFTCEHAPRAERLYYADDRHRFRAGGSLPADLPTTWGFIRGDFLDRDNGRLYYGDLRRNESRIVVVQTEDGGDDWEPNRTLTDLQIVDAAPRNASSAWYLGLSSDDREKETWRAILYIGDLDGENLRRVDWPDDVPEVLAVNHPQKIPYLAESWEGGVVLTAPGARQTWYVPVSEETGGPWSISRNLIDIDLDGKGAGWMVLYGEIDSGYGWTLYRIGSGEDAPERVLDSPHDLDAVHLTGPGRALILGYPFVLQTVDNGESWHYLPFDVATLLTWEEAGRGYLYGAGRSVMILGDEKELYLYTRGGIFPLSIERRRPWEG